ncbi:hypothetical protein CSKR_101503 [Clonorchis sinensis]|uniref:Uncharacterized protein n=1 Tax=Clonorchis sinensis TaxID=79923 RepID=A0A3R7F8R9_CLOSI|nr:hypothetical protein CSKR_101503 [Clonorchis sinensis]
MFPHFLECSNCQDSNPFYIISIFVLGEGVRWFSGWNANLLAGKSLVRTRLGQCGSIPATVLPSGGMAARHRYNVTAERLFIYYYLSWFHSPVIFHLSVRSTRILSAFLFVHI